MMNLYQVRVSLIFFFPATRIEKVSEVWVQNTESHMRRGATSMQRSSGELGYFEKHIMTRWPLRMLGCEDTFKNHAYVYAYVSIPLQ